MTDLSYIELCLAANVPMLLEGVPGCGKTATIHALAKKLGKKTVTTIASLCEPVEFGGFIIYTPDGIRREPDSFARLLTNDSVWILDEISNAAPAVQASLLRAVHERKIGDFCLPPEARIIGAYNDESYASSGHLFTAPFISRFCVMKFKFNPNDWVENFPSYWGDVPEITPALDPDEWAKWRGLIAAFLSQRLTQVMAFPTDETKRSHPFPNPRQWENVSLVLCAAPNPMMAREVIAGLVGDSAAHELVNWLKLVDLPEPKEVLANPEMWKIPSAPDVLFAALSSITLYATNKMNLKTWDALWRVFGRIADSKHADIACAFIKQIGPLEPRGAVIPREVARFQKLIARAGI